MKARGLSLIEVMVALLLIATASTLSYRALASVINGTGQAGQVIDTTRDFDRLFARLEREILQRAPQAKIEGGDGSLALSSLGEAREVRVTYRLDQQRLWRQSAPLDEVLFEGVARFAVRFLGEDGQWVERWAADNPAPRAIEISLAQGGAEASRVFDLP